ncbi:hypothetical protein EDC56_1252 [Sinobacterium caligoides]|uniref:Uncharacterized protein n=1 Tax=Sinobacterium caligoides TaxID=933926 RepID=A0A3N2E0Q8_9GAMM|nr:hypothetical protein [Sinobacterium caligoides]ROS05703.1 hypothetical protein EDC56_1252 [Sinobacterium caligoides]
MISQTLSTVIKIGGSVDPSLKKSVGYFGKLGAKAEAAKSDVKKLKGEQSKLLRELKKTEKGSKEYNKLEQEIDQATRSIKKAERAQARYNSRLKSHQRLVSMAKTGLLAVGVAAVASAGMLLGCADAAAENLDAVGKMSNSLGIASDRLQEMYIAAGHAGLSQGEFNTSIRKSTKALGNFANNGTGAAKTAMKQLGLSMEDLKDKTPSEQLDLVADSLLKVKNQSEKVGIANQIYGSTGVKMLEMMKDGSVGLAQAYADAAATGAIASEEQIADSAAYNDAQQKLKDTFAGLMNVINAGVIPVMTSLFSGMTAFIVKYKPFFLDLFAGFKEFGAVFLPLVRVGFSGLIQVAKTAYTVFQVIKSIVLWIGEKIGGWGKLFGKVANGLQTVQGAVGAVADEEMKMLGVDTEPFTLGRVSTAAHIARPKSPVPSATIAMSAKTAQQAAPRPVQNNNNVTQHISVNGQDAHNTALTIKRRTCDHLTDGGQM